MHRRNNVSNSKINNMSIYNNKRCEIKYKNNIFPLPTLRYVSKLYIQKKSKLISIYKYILHI